jgi:hypothetical protein
LTAITIPKTVESVGGFAFGQCPSLASVTIENSMTKFSSGSFGITPWEEAKRSENPYVIENHVLFETPGGRYTTEPIVIPDGVVNIAGGAVSSLEWTTEITIPDSVKIIGNRAFYGDLGITEITIPDSVISIGEEAFYGCEKLAVINVPDSVTEIGEDAFA